MPIYFSNWDVLDASTFVSAYDTFDSRHFVSPYDTYNSTYFVSNNAQTTPRSYKLPGGFLEWTIRLPTGESQVHAGKVALWHSGTIAPGIATSELGGGKARIAEGTTTRSPYWGSPSTYMTPRIAPRFTAASADIAVFSLDGGIIEESRRFLPSQNAIVRSRCSSFGASDYAACAYLDSGSVYAFAREAEADISSSSSSCSSVSIGSSESSSSFSSRSTSAPIGSSSTSTISYLNDYCLESVPGCWPANIGGTYAFTGSYFNGKPAYWNGSYYLFYQFDAWGLQYWWSIYTSIDPNSYTAYNIVSGDVVVGTYQLGAGCGNPAYMTYGICNSSTSSTSVSSKSSWSTKSMSSESSSSSTSSANSSSTVASYTSSSSSSSCSSKTTSLSISSLSSTQWLVSSQTSTSKSSSCVTILP